jgi:hypothetical protein
LCNFIDLELKTCSELPCSSELPTSWRELLMPQWEWPHVGHKAYCLQLARL